MQRPDALTPCAARVVKEDRLTFFIKAVLRMWGVPDKLPAGSPVPLPISLELPHLPLLATQHYLVGAKMDGVRYLLLLVKLPAAMGGFNVSVMINRAWDAYPVQVAAAEKYFEQGSLLDGELVEEAVEGRTRQVYYAFDVVQLAGKTAATLPYNERLSLLEHVLLNEHQDVQQLYDPVAWMTRNAAALAKQGCIVCCGNGSFLTLRCRRWFNVRDVDFVLQHQLAMATDGLIFMPVDERIGTRRHPRLFKHKTVHSVDLLVQNNTLFYFDGSGNSSDPVPVGASGWKLVTDSPVQDGVYEFVVSKYNGVNTLILTPVLLRADKQHPNDVHTVASALRLWMAPVTQDSIVQACKANPWTMNCVVR